jgi:hypothetical protein
MNPRNTHAAPVLRGPPISLGERLELLRLRAAADRLGVVLARQELAQRSAPLRGALRWLTVLAEALFPRRAGAAAGLGGIRLAAWLLPLIVAKVGRWLLRGRVAPSGAKRKGAWAGMTLGALLLGWLGRALGRR